MQQLTRIREVFQLPKPTQFVDPDHCSECSAHNQVLLEYSVESISLAQLGKPGWDPICFIDEVGYKYYLPALARLALGTGDDYYLDQFLFHLNDDRIRTFSRTEAEVLTKFLLALVEMMPEEIEANLDSEGILACIKNLQALV